MARRQPFGNVSKLPSGNYRARYRDPRVKAPRRGSWVNAPRTFAVKAEAEAWLAGVRTDLARGTWRHPAEAEAEHDARERERTARERLDGVTVAGWAERWLAERHATMAVGTVRKRSSDLRTHIVPALGPRRLIDLTPRDIADWYADLPTDGVRASCYQTLRAMLNAAVESKDTALAENPCRIKGGGRPRASRGERYRLRPEEVAAIAGALRPELRALVLLLADAGLRINEALALRRGDVTLGRRAAFVDVAHSLVHQGKSLVPGPTKTRRVRRVQITPATADALAGHLSAFAEPGPDGIVFPGFSDSSRYLRASSASRALREAMASAGVVIPAGRYGGWHAFRHYSATRFGQAGASTAAIMRRYGWSRPEQAMHYQRADADYERDVLDRMARLAGPEAETWDGRALEAADAGVVDLSSRRRRKA